MNIEWAFLAAGGALIEGRLVVREPGIDRIVVAGLPARLALPLLVNLRGMPEDFPGDHELEMYLLGPQTAPLDDLSQGITLPSAPEGHDPRQALSTTLLFVPAFVATTEGGHGFDLRLDNKTARLVHFMVVRRSAVSDGQR